MAVAKTIRTTINDETFTSQFFPYYIKALPSSAFCYNSKTQTDDFAQLLACKRAVFNFPVPCNQELPSPVRENRLGERLLSGIL
jgi:hypothetical protein